MGTRLQSLSFDSASYGEPRKSSSSPSPSLSSHGLAAIGDKYPESTMPTLSQASQGTEGTFPLGQLG